MKYLGENTHEPNRLLPFNIVRNGAIIILTALLLLAFFAFTPYSETTTAKVTVGRGTKERCQIKGLLPYSFISDIKNGMVAKVELDGFNNKQHTPQHGIVEYVSPEVINIDGKNYFSFIIVVKSNPFIQTGMKGKATIIVSEKTLLKKILRKD